MNGFHKVSLKEKEFTLAFENERGDAVVDKCADVRMKTTHMVLNGFYPIRYYTSHGDIYVYFNRYYIKKMYQDVPTSVPINSDKSPLIIPVIYGGEKKTLIVGKLSGQVTAVIDNTVIPNIPYGTSYALAGGRLFIADGTRIYFSDTFDYTDFTVGLSFGGFIDVEDKAGSIIFIAEVKGEVIVLCKYAAYILSPFGKQCDFTFKKISSFYLDVKENSAALSKDTVYFVSEDNFCSIYDGKVKILGKGLDGITFTSGYADCTEGVYVLPLTINAGNYIYYYDEISGLDKIKSTGDYIVTGAYAHKPTSGSVFLVKKYESPYIRYGTCGEYDFGTCLKKAITRVEAHITGSAALTVTGDQVKTATLTEKCNVMPCFLHGTTFDFSFSDRSADFKVDKLIIKYVVYGGVS